MAKKNKKTKRGLWLVGARGAVATTTALGVAALARGLTESLGLVSELPEFAPIPFVDWKNWVLGGHDIRDRSLNESANELRSDLGPFAGDLAEKCADDLTEIDSRIRPGVLFQAGEAIDSLATPGYARSFATARACIEAIKSDLAAFQRENAVSSVVVILVASTEPESDRSAIPEAWNQLAKRLEGPSHSLRASSLYAIAAMELGMPFVNFTPSLGADCPAIEELACRQRVCHAGRDGKTGETLMKTALAPALARRNLEVLSWVGHNILGNNDGRVLDDPLNRAAKVACKDAALASILGYAPQTLVSIEYIPSLGDRKTAWDHVHFRGFMGTPMALQLTWQGCDSALAAPLVLDLARFTEFASRQGEIGTLGYLGSFFKTPMGCPTHDFREQYSILLSHVLG